MFPWRHRYNGDYSVVENNSFTKAAIVGDDTKTAFKLGVENVDAEMGIDQKTEDDDDNGYDKEAE